MSNNDCCISDILNTIVILQNNCEKLDNIPNSCDSPILGIRNSNTFVYNTRPITFYNCAGGIWTFPYSITYDGAEVTGTSSVLRVEKVEGCCAIARVLAPNPDTTSVFPYAATDDFVTLNLECTCIIKCLPDTYINCI